MLASNRLRRPPPPTVRSIVVSGLQGLGDSIHQRGVVRQLMQRAPVWLETSWPCVYHDLVGDRLHLLYKGSPVPVYHRNAEREHASFTGAVPPQNSWPMKISYTPASVRSAGSVLAGMCHETGTDIAKADFRLPIPDAWAKSVDLLLSQWKADKPLLIYRPLVERSWWGGCTTRNPDHAVYAALMRSICDRFFVVSVADFRGDDEWLVGEPIDADVTVHAGELDFETLAALTNRAALVFTSPGFGVILAQAVGTPSCVVFGGYEDARSFSAGARYAPYLPIEPLTPCACFRHNHTCDKQIDLASALVKLHGFLEHTVLPLAPTGQRLKVPPLKLPSIPQASLDIRPIHCAEKLPKRYMNAGELEALVALVRSVHPRCMVEIGTNTGRTARALLDNVPSLQRYIGIDVLPGYEFGCAVQSKEVPLDPGHYANGDPRFELLLPPRGSFDLAPADLGSCDVVFIDGDHSRRAVVHDTQLARQVLRPGGLIIWHDYHDLGTVDVREVLHEELQQGSSIAHIEGTWIAFQLQTPNAPDQPQNRHEEKHG